MATGSIYFDAIRPAKTSWAWADYAAGGYMNTLRSTIGTQGAWVEFDFEAEAGTYTLDLAHLRGTNRGIYTISIDGVDVGTADGYDGTTNYIITSIAGIVIAQTGMHTLKLRMDTKNASSSSYIGAVCYAELMEV